MARSLNVRKIRSNLVPFLFTFPLSSFLLFVLTVFNHFSTAVYYAAGENDKRHDGKDQLHGNVLSVAEEVCDSVINTQKTIAEFDIRSVIWNKWNRQNGRYKYNCLENHRKMCCTL